MFTNSIKLLNTSSKCYIPKKTIKSTTFPKQLHTLGLQYKTQPSVNAYSYALALKADIKDQRPTVISSDSDEVATVSDHVRV
ncbi:hypothetical protein KDRO_C01080 [Kluyveromyces lactis]|uniref:KLLA0C17237p n=1 Tax=Kluyveromyces lactis (strain ATCC 8585 / CBS 2359 / DSM 70799 / NBRC 1267 / NRRL Y-1140 / WM37) TaxID=284590 RepID=B5FV64_KLULA|nr:uncharacterized protein KLLA0_C17237g [Kluyveromyces lactis]QEU59587.1 hypothetical protein KDRO_C01080 [Kluyveromyces lactis]CAR64365.1 KLLA0C17237p [Kluyveromyces lactis]|eukprot:XP_002999361.1 uncharacterized protein KLLA0_C17237g [Kluyveromyces lactis]